MCLSFHGFEILKSGGGVVWWSILDLRRVPRSDAVLKLLSAFPGQVGAGQGAVSKLPEHPRESSGPRTPRSGPNARQLGDGAVGTGANRRVFAAGPFHFAASSRCQTRVRVEFPYPPRPVAYTVTTTCEPVYKR